MSSTNPVRMVLPWWRISTRALINSSSHRVYAALLGSVSWVFRFWSKGVAAAHAGSLPLLLAGREPWWSLGGDGFFDPVADLAFEVFLGGEGLKGFVEF